MKNFKIILLMMALFLLCTFSVNAQDLRSQLDVNMIIAPHATGEDVTSGAIDSRNFKSQLIVVHSGIATYTATDKLDIVMSQCDTAVGTFTPVLDRQIWGPQTVDENGTILTLDEALAAEKVYKILYLGRSPYIKIKADYSGGHVATPTVQVFSVQGGKIIQE